jgi:hypothetical protein
MAQAMNFGHGQSAGQPSGVGHTDEFGDEGTLVMMLPQRTKEHYDKGEVVHRAKDGLHHEDQRDVREQGENYQAGEEKAEEHRDGGGHKAQGG